MTHATPNLNGTSRRELSEQLNDAYVAADELIRKLYAAMPNARDYTPQGSPAGLATHQQAVEEMIARVQLVRGIQRELETLAEHIEMSKGGR